MYGRAVARVFLAIAIALAALDVRAQTVVRPLSVTGPYPVACTNVEQDFARVPAGETAEMYWRGASTGSKKRYVDALLVAPANALTSVRSAAPLIYALSASITDCACGLDCALMIANASADT